MGAESRCSHWLKTRRCCSSTAMVAAHSPATLGLYYSAVKIAMLSCLVPNLSLVSGEGSLEVVIAIYVLGMRLFGGF